MLLFILMALLILMFLFAFVELTIGWSLKQERKFYRKLFNLKNYLLTLFGCFLLFLIPLDDLLSVGHYENTYFFIGNEFLAMPFFYLMLFKIADGLSLLINRRHIIITTGSDDTPAEFRWYIDSVLAWLALAGSFFIPLTLEGFLNK